MHGFFLVPGVKGFIGWLQGATVVHCEMEAP